MRIAFSRTGGFAGTGLTADFPPGSLPPEVEEELRRLADDARFFDLPDEPPAPVPGADRFVYRVSLEDGARRNTVRVVESSASLPLRALLRRLAELARERR